MSVSLVQTYQQQTPPQSAGDLEGAKRSHHPES